MAERFQAIRGMHDILPGRVASWQRLEATVRHLMRSYGYQEIRLPLVEMTALFSRSIGEVTDIVEKEMYSFADRNGDGLSLRPEGTAGCVRAVIEHGLIETTQRLWYQGPMFRYERPQKGRYRQFHQIGVEVFGLPGPASDLELILLTARLWRLLGLNDLTLQINTLGIPSERLAYRADLVTYFNNHYAQLDADSRRRLETNPLRILDSKHPELQALLNAAPVLMDYLGADSRTHFEALCAGLDACQITYKINPHLVRGLDYYTRTVFEWITHDLGTQGTVCAGGRYDGLVEQLGGRPTPAVGFAMGLERLVALLETQTPDAENEGLDAYLILVGAAAERAGLALAERLRDALPELRLQTHCGGGSFKSQFKKADKSGAHYALILGDTELEHSIVGIKPLRGQGPQQEVPLTTVAETLRLTLSAQKDRAV